MIFYLLFWTIPFLSTVEPANNKSVLHFGYITSLTGLFIPSGGRPAVDLALKLINEREDILQNYTLSYTDVLDSECSHTKALDQFFELIQQRNVTYISLLGCGCSTATIPVAEVSHYWNIPQLDYASPANVLNDRTRFRNFFRTFVSFHHISSSLGQLMREFGWEQLSVITQDESLFTTVTNDLENSIFRTEGWILDRYDVPNGQDPLHYFDRNEAGTFNIIHINAYPNIAYTVLCEAYHRGMVSPTFLWILPSWYSADWWRSNSTYSSNNASCTNQIMMQVLAGSLAIVPDGYLTLQNESIVTFSGLTPSMYLDNYTDLILNDPLYENLTLLGLSGVAFDGVWAIAVGLDLASQRLSSDNVSGCEDLPGDLLPLDQFDYTNMKLGCIIRQSFSEVNFLGLTGQISFNEKGSRNDSVVLFQQYRVANGTVVKASIATVTVLLNRTYFTFQNGESNTTLWNNGKPPYDGFPVTAFDKNSIILVFMYDMVATCGLVFVIVCFAFNVAFRNRKIIKLTSYKLNYIVILGSALLYTCVFFYSLSLQNPIIQTIFCNTRVWLFSLSYDLCFGVILAKTWRVYYIFNNPKPKKKGVRDWHLLLIIFSIVAIDVVIILVGSILPQSGLTSFQAVDGEHPQVINDEGKLQRNYVYVCNKEIGTIAWLGVSFGYKGMLQVLAIFMAFHTRRVKVKVLNESMETATIIYINSIIIVLLIVIEFTLPTHHNTYSALFGLGLLIEGTLFVGIIFIPKMIRLYFDPKGDNIFPQNGTVAPATLTINIFDEKESSEEINLTKRVKELERQLAEIMKDIAPKD